MLGKAKGSADYANYLTCILSTQNASTLDMSQSDGDLARSAAAISLKNVVKARYKSIPPDSQAFIKSSVVKCLQDTSAAVRNYTGSVITEIVTQGSIVGWPEIVPELLILAGNDQGDSTLRVQEAAMSALEKVCEDNRKILESNIQGHKPLDAMIPPLYRLAGSPSATIRAQALAIINIFIMQRPKILVSTLDTLLQQLFNLAMDPNEKVRLSVCKMFVSLVEAQPSKLQQHMPSLVDYMVSQQHSDKESKVALETAEFWLAVGEQSELCPHLAPHLDKIVPVLLGSMVYSQTDIDRHEADRNDAGEEDKVEEIKPRFANPKAARTGGGDNTAVTNGTNSAETIREDLSEGEIEEEDQGKEAGDPEDEWNLRKCSAAALDVLATQFHGPVFDISLPYLREHLTHKDWPNREAAVLAIGAVADGCMDAVMPHLPELVPFLISLLNDSEPVVRKITCWTLGRYSRWAAFLPPDQKQQFYEPMMDGILKRMLDGNKAVQEAAASAFSSLEESSRKQLLPYCKVIIDQFVRCFAVYKDKNMFILYDCVQTLAENLGSDLAQPELMNSLMPALIDRWSTVPDEGHELFPLLECLSYVAPALGDSFSPFAAPIFVRSVKILHANIQQDLYATQNTDALDRPNKDFRVTSLDLLSSIIQALPQEKSGELVEKSEPEMLDLLLYCMQDRENDVRQSAYALLGDCAGFVFPYLQPALPIIMPVLTNQLDADSLPDEVAEEAFSVVNNACWSCGEIAIKETAGMATYLDDLYGRLLAIILNPDITPSVHENAMIALGRLGIWCASQLAPRLGEFAVRFLEIMRPVEFTEEKAQAFLGLNRCVLANPTGLEKALLEWFGMASRYASHGFFGDKDLKDSFDNVSNACGRLQDCS